MFAGLICSLPLAVSRCFSETKAAPRVLYLASDGAVTLFWPPGKRCLAFGLHYPSQHLCCEQKAKLKSHRHNCVLMPVHAFARLWRTLHRAMPRAKAMSRVMRPGLLLRQPSPSCLCVSEFAHAEDSVMQGSKGWHAERSAGYLPYTNNKLY